MDTMNKPSPADVITEIEKIQGKKAENISANLSEATISEFIARNYRGEVPPASVVAQNYLDNEINTTS